MLHHVIMPDYWAENLNKNPFFPPTFGAESFVHLCTDEQLDGVLSRYYQGVEKVILLHLDPSQFTAELKYEAATNNELFPHLYGGINKEAILRVEEREL